MYNSWMNPISLFCKSREFKQQLELLRPRLYRLAFSWTQDHALSDDLTQETLVKAIKSSSQLRDKKKLHSWAFGILHNCYRDHFRKHKKLENVDDYDFIDERQPDTDYEHFSITDAVRNAVSRLPENQRQIVTLVDLENFSYADVAQILDVPIGTVMSRLCRARKALAQKLLNYSEPKDTTVTLRRIK
ncbi:MAG: RNA polymerase sigma factor [Thioalkalispiraceae bacterium]